MKVMLARLRQRSGAALVLTLATGSAALAQADRPWVDPPARTDTPAQAPAAAPSQPAPAPAKPEQAAPPANPAPPVQSAQPREAPPPPASPPPGPSSRPDQGAQPAAPAAPKRAARPEHSAPAAEPPAPSRQAAPPPEPPPVRSARPARPPPSEPVEAARPRSAPDAPPAGAASAAQRLAIDYLGYWSAPNPLTLDATPDFYAPVVRFHGREMSARALFEEKRRFVHRWPERHYNPRLDTMQTECDPATEMCTVRTVFEFTALSPERGRRSQGSARLELGVRFSGKRPVIVSERSRVIHRGRSPRSVSFENADD